MIERIQQFIEEHHLLRREDPLIAAVSGGADSLCLLEVLHRLGYSVTAVHVQHHLRESAERDAAFTAAFAGERGIPFIRRDANVAERVRETGESVEEAARTLRYALLEEERQALEKRTGRPAVIALAHHRNDQAETVLFQMIRGSGLRGLAGMRPARDHVVRPLLFLSRAEIEEFMEREGLPYCRDETNLDPRMSRNDLRQHVLPALSSVRADAVEKIAETAELLAETDDYLTETADRWLSEHAKADPEAQEIRIGEDFRKESPVLGGYILREAIRKTGASLKDVTRNHIREIAALFEKEVGKQLFLPGHRMAEKEYHAVRIAPVSGEKEALLRPAAPRMEIRLFKPEKGQKIPEKDSTKWFDYDKIKGDILLRHRTAGDVFSTREGTHKKLKDWMIDEKIPKALRSGLFVVADEEEVLWVPGYRRGESKKITDETKTVLEVTVIFGDGEE